jgi:NADH-quinone oxidoreductase subunit K
VRWCWRGARTPNKLSGLRGFGGVVVPISYYLVLSAILFGLGMIAFVFKRNIITLFMAIELMLNAVNLAFVAFSRALGQLQGQVFVFFVIVVAAAEAAVGLAIVIVIARNRQTLNVERVDSLKN